MYYLVMLAENNGERCSWGQRGEWVREVGDVGAVAAM